MLEKSAYAAILIAALCGVGFDASHEFWLLYVASVALAYCVFVIFRMRRSIRKYEEGMRARRR